MKFLEKDLEQILFTTDKDLLSEKGLFIHQNLKRQVRIGKYGIADMVSLCKEDHYYDSENQVIRFRPLVTIYELKQDKISVSAFLQAMGYAKGIKSYLLKRNPEFYKYLKIRVVLVGRSIDTFSSFIYLPQLINGEDFEVEYYTYSYDVDGINFQYHYNYNLTNQGF